MLAIIGGGAGSAFAQCATPVTALCPGQTADQEKLLSPFNTLLGTPAGVSLLNTSLQTDNSIYLNSTPAQKIASSTVLVVSAVPANILLRAFPGNPNYFYNSAGLPTAPALPAPVAAAVDAITSNAQLDNVKSDFGISPNIYGHAYGLLPGQIDSLGNPPPYQVSAAIQNNPFTAANSSAFAAQNQQTQGSLMVNWQGLVPGTDSMIADFPSAHTMLATFDAITAAILAPGYYQQLARSVEDFAYDLNVFGVHYPLDVIGGRILGTYVLAQTLSGNPLYPSAIPINLASLSQAMQAYFGGGGSSPYATACGGNVAACVAGGAIPSAAKFGQQIRAYTNDLTYGLPSVGDTTLPPAVPPGASVLIATRFPYMNTAQLNQVLATTELPSGVPLDNGTGWARLNLYAAASGYGAFPTNVTVNMNAAAGGLNAFDIWSNSISGPGGLTLQGSGTLILAGNNSYTGDTIVQGGTLAVTGSVAGNVAVWSGASFAGNGVIGGSLAFLAGSTFQAAVGPSGANLIQVGGTATLSGGTLSVASVGDPAALGSAWPVLTAAGGIIRQLRFTDRARERSRRRHAVRHAVRQQRNFPGRDPELLRQPRRRRADGEQQRKRRGCRAGCDPPRTRCGAGSCSIGAVRPALSTARRQHHRGFGRAGAVDLPRRYDHGTQFLVHDCQCGRRSAGGPARSRRRSRRQQRARTGRQHDLGERARRL